MLLPRESARLIHARSKHVAVNEDTIAAIDIWPSKTIRELHNSWHSLAGHPSTSHPLLIDYIFIIDCLNFSFWSESLYSVNGRRGYGALLEVLGRLGNYAPRCYTTLSWSDWRGIFRTDQDTEFPMAKERVAILQQNGKKLISNYDGSATNILRKANFDVMKTVRILSEEFAGFDDGPIKFQNANVSFLKKAQIFVADVYAAIGQDGYLSDINQLTMFADYRVPQVLYSLAVLKYDEELLRTIDKRTLKFGEEMEVEIRGNSVYAVEEMAKRFGVPPMNVDFALWNYAGTHWDTVSRHPMHKTRSIYY